MIPGQKSIKMTVNTFVMLLTISISISCDTQDWSNSFAIPGMNDILKRIKSSSF